VLAACHQYLVDHSVLSNIPLQQGAIDTPASSLMRASVSTMAVRPKALSLNGEPEILTVPNPVLQYGHWNESVRRSLSDDGRSPIRGLLRILRVA
jgi:hypothetical protein